MSPTVRRACLDEVDALAALKLATFRESFVDEGFAIPYPEADLATFLLATYAPAVVAAELADPAKATWVAEAEGGLLAYATVGPCKLPHEDVRPEHGELYQIYVRNAAQGLGLGRALLDLALDHLALTRPGPIWLGVWSGNHKAQALYAKRGFCKIGDYKFPVGAWRDAEFIFRRG